MSTTQNVGISTDPLDLIRKAHSAVTRAISRYRSAFNCLEKGVHPVWTEPSLTLDRVAELSGAGRSKLDSWLADQAGNKIDSGDASGHVETDEMSQFDAMKFVCFVNGGDRAELLAKLDPGLEFCNLFPDLFACLPEARRLVRSASPLLHRDGHEPHDVGHEGGGCWHLSALNSIDRTLARSGAVDLLPVFRKVCTGRMLPGEAGLILHHILRKQGNPPDLGDWSLLPHESVLTGERDSALQRWANEPGQARLLISDLPSEKADLRQLTEDQSVEDGDDPLLDYEQLRILMGFQSQSPVQNWTQEDGKPKPVIGHRGKHFFRYSEWRQAVIQSEKWKNLEYRLPESYAEARK